MNKYHTRVVALDIDGEQYLGLEIPAEVFTSLNLKDGEVLETSVEDNALVLKRTGIISNGT